MIVRVRSVADWKALIRTLEDFDGEQLAVEVSGLDLDDHLTFNPDNRLPPSVSDLRMVVHNCNLTSAGALEQGLSRFTLVVTNSRLDNAPAYNLYGRDAAAKVEIDCTRSRIETLDVAHNGARLVTLSDTEVGRLVTKTGPVDSLHVSRSGANRRGLVRFGLSEHNGSEITEAVLDGVELASIDPARFYFRYLTLRGCKMTGGLSLGERPNDLTDPFAVSLHLSDTTIDGDLLIPPGTVEQLVVESSRIAGRTELHTEHSVVLRHSTLQGATSVRGGQRVDLAGTTFASSTTIAVRDGVVDLHEITVEDRMVVGLSETPSSGCVSRLGGARLLGELRLARGIVLAAPDLVNVEGLEQLELSHPDQLPKPATSVANRPWHRRWLFDGRAYAGMENEGCAERSEAAASTYGRLRSKARSQSKGGLESALLLAEYETRLSQGGLTKPVLYAYGIFGGFGIRFLRPLGWFGFLVVVMAAALSDFGGGWRLQPFVDALRTALPGLAPSRAPESSSVALLATITSAIAPLLVGFTAFGLRWQVRRS